MPERELFKPWPRGKCEFHLVLRRGNRPYCDKRGRWFLTTRGYILCGEHKREAEKRYA